MKKLLLALPLLATMAHPIPLAAKPRSGMKGIAAIDPGYCKGTDGKEAIFGAIIAALLPSLVQKGVKGIGTALTKAGQPDETTISGSAGGYFYSLDSQQSPNRLTAKCFAYMAIYDGEPKPDNQDLGEESFRFYEQKGAGKSVAFLYTAKVEIAADGSAWRLVPEAVHIGPSLTGSSKGTRGRDLVVWSRRLMVRV